jgi:predicted AlkP superfamily pyrophosphatase or phosphodiesterase
LYETQEIRFWQQARELITGETVYEKASEEFGDDFTTALIFFWFSQGALSADYRVIPKPWYGSDGSKEFDIHGTPKNYVTELNQKLGDFPFFTFWGPHSGPPATEWIAEATAHTLKSRQPNLTLSYLPLLDYPMQKHGPRDRRSMEALSKVDQCVKTIKKAADQTDTKLMIFSEYGLSSVNKPVHINRTFRKEGWLNVKYGLFGERLNIGQSTVFAASDHQVAHVYVRDNDLIEPTRNRLRNLEGVDQVWGEQQQREQEIFHPRSGDFIAIADPGAWFTYYFWLDDDRAPDYARTVDIHSKPGYDPVEMFVDPEISFPGAKAAWTVLKKKLGFRYRMELTPLDATLIEGSHGRPAPDPENGPVLITAGLEPPTNPDITNLKSWLLDVYRDR